MKCIIYPYKMGSASAKLLARAFETKRVFPDGRYRLKPNHVVINWGSSTVPNWYRENYGVVLNKPSAVANAANKLKTFQILQANDVSIPEWTTSREVASQYEGVVVCRTVVSGSQGQGIVIAETPDELVSAPLYTKHVRHKHEFRVHVMNGNVIDFTQKKKRRDVGEAEVSNFVRNHEGNWVFCREGVVLPDDVATQAIKAVVALGLDFGAVDVAYREREDKAFILEVNCAPGVDPDGTTLQRYISALKENYDV